MNKVLRAHIAVAVVNLIYGANFTIAKAIMPQYIKPAGFIVLRVVIALILFFIISPFLAKEKVERRDLGMLMLCGLFGVAINQMLFFKGLALTFPINGAIIMTTNPILVLIIAAILIRERITWQKLLGILLGITGALSLLLIGRELSFDSDTFRGDLFIFINAMSYGIFLVISKPLLKKYKPITMIKWSFFFGALMVVPFGWNEVVAVQWHELTTNLWLGVAYVVVATTFLAYLLNTVALNTLSPAVVSSYIYLQPVIATSIAMMLGKDRLTIPHVISTLLIFTGVYLVGRTPPSSKAVLSEEVEKN